NAPQAQPTHCASSRDRLVTCGYGFARDHFLTEAYQFINLGGELLADLIFFLIPGTLGSKGRAQPRGIAGVQPPDLLQQGSVLGRVYHDSNLLKDAGERAAAFDKVTVESLVWRDKVFFCNTHLAQQDLQQAFFCLNACGVYRQDSGAEAGEMVQLQEGIKTHTQNESDEGKLSEDNTPEDCQTHISLLSKGADRLIPNLTLCRPPSSMLRV